jgi:elongator complex protein 1
MSSYQLVFSPQGPSVPKGTGVPIHVSFSSSEDSLAALWESGLIELWNLHTRIGPGRGGTMVPKLIWKGYMGHHDTTHFREIGVWTAPHSLRTAGAVARIAVLGYAREHTDVLRVIEVTLEHTIEVGSIALDGIGWRFVASDDVVRCHRLGNVYECTCSALHCVATDRITRRL